MAELCTCRASVTGCPEHDPRVRPDTVMVDREQMEAVGKVVDAARALLAIAPRHLEQLVGPVAVRNLRGAIAGLDAYSARRKD